MNTSRLVEHRKHRERESERERERERARERERESERERAREREREREREEGVASSNSKTLIYSVIHIKVALDPFGLNSQSLLLYELFSF